MISVTLVSYNSPDITVKAIKSIVSFLDVANQNYEFIVVDNASKEDNVVRIRDSFPQVKLICLEENVGFARAHNIAIKQSRGEFIFIANSDITIMNNVFVKSVERFLSDPKLGAIGPLILEKDGSKASTSRDTLFYSLPSTMLSVLNSVFPMVNRAEAQTMPSFIKKVFFAKHESAMPVFISREVEWVDGMFVAFSRKHLVKVGLFDSFYFFDHEIGDILNRLRDSGALIYYDAQQEVMHLGGYSRKRNPKIVHASLIGFMHYIYNNKPEYFKYISKEIIFLSNLKKILSELSGDEENYRLWRTVSSDALQYTRSPVDRRYTTPFLGENL